MQFQDLHHAASLPHLTGEIKKIIKKGTDLAFQFYSRTVPFYISEYGLLTTSFSKILSTPSKDKTYLGFFISKGVSVEKFSKKYLLNFISPLLFNSSSNSYFPNKTKDIYLKFSFVFPNIL